MLAEHAVSELQQKLQTLGFTLPQARIATQALSQSSALSSTLLASLSPLDACLEYLLLHVPECDLPKRFLPSINTSNSFVSSAHSGTEDLKLRWIQEKAVKECGWPAHVVKECITNSDFAQNWGLLVKELNIRLMGDDFSPSPEHVDTTVLDEDELEALGATFVDDLHLKLPMPIAPLHLHIIFPSTPYSLASHGDPPPMYITSSEAPSYVRLHILSRVINAFAENNLVDPGESTVMAMVRILEEEWAFMQDNGPPDMSSVLKHLLPRRRGADQTAILDVSEPTTPSPSSRKRGPRTGRKDGRADSVVKEEFHVMSRNPAYRKILSARQKLPAFSAKDSFLTALEKNRCVVVVGETGENRTHEYRNH